MVLFDIQHTAMNFMRILAKLRFKDGLVLVVGAHPEEGMGAADTVTLRHFLGEHHLQNEAVLAEALQDVGRGCFIGVQVADVKLVTL